MSRDDRPPDQISQADTAPGDPEPDPALDALVRAAARPDGPPTPHPPPDELLAYQQRTLEPAAAEAVRAHLTACPRCARAVLDFGAFPDLEPPAGSEAPGRFDRERLWRGVEAGLAETGPAETAGAPSPARPTAAGPGRTATALRWVSGLAAVLLLATVVLAVWVVRLHTAAPAPRTDLAFHTLVPQAAAGTVRGEAQEVVLPPWAERMVLLLTYGGLEELDTYRLELVDAEGRTVWSEPRVHRGAGGVFTLEVDRRTLAPGRYTLHLWGGDGGGTEDGAGDGPLARYELSVVHG